MHLPHFILENYSSLLSRLGLQDKIILNLLKLIWILWKINKSLTVAIKWNRKFCPRQISTEQLLIFRIQNGCNSFYVLCLGNLFLLFNIRKCLADGKRYADTHHLRRREMTPIASSLYLLEQECFNLFFSPIRVRTTLSSLI